MKVVWKNKKLCFYSSPASTNYQVTSLRSLIWWCSTGQFTKGSFKYYSGHCVYWIIDAVPAWLPKGRATDIVFVTLFCIAVGTAIARHCGCCAMLDGHCLNILLFWQRSTAALVFLVGACFEVSLFCPLFPLVPIPNRPFHLWRLSSKDQSAWLGCMPLWWFIGC